MARQPVKKLTLFDSTCIIVGIIIGAGIYETSSLVASCMGGWVGVMSIWLAGGLLALTGALCYSELAVAWPHQGGDYIYLNHAYGSWAGYLFGWSQLAIIRPGDIALMAFVFARYAITLYAPFKNMTTFYAAAAVTVLTLINILGVQQGKWTQNILTVGKVLGLLFVVVAGLLAPGGQEIPMFGNVSGDGIKLALILVLFTYGGWNEMAYVAAEVKNPQKNIFRALVFGTLAVVLMYLLINGAFLYALGYKGMSGSEAVAVDTVSSILPRSAAKVIGILICISALGAVNGLIFTGARISYALGEDYNLFRLMGKWHPRLGTPVWALTIQGALSLAIVLIAGSFVDTILYSAPAVWLFFFATGTSIYVLRHKQPDHPRPYKVIGYPITPLIFCASCLFMFYSSVTYSLANKPVGLVVLLGVVLVGLAFYFVPKSRGKQSGFHA